MPSTNVTLYAQWLARPPTGLQLSAPTRMSLGVSWNVSSWGNRLDDVSAVPRHERKRAMDHQVYNGPPRAHRHRAHPRDTYYYEVQATTPSLGSTSAVRTVSGRHTTDTSMVQREALQSLRWQSARTGRSARSVPTRRAPTCMDLRSAPVAISYGGRSQWPDLGLQHRLGRKPHQAPRFTILH